MGVCSGDLCVNPSKWMFGIFIYNIFIYNIQTFLRRTAKAERVWNASKNNLKQTCFVYGFYFTLLITNKMSIDM